MRIPFIMTIFLYILSICTDLYIWNDIRRFCTRRLGSQIYAATAIACWLFLTIVLCLPRREADSEIRIIMWMLYTYISIYLPKLVYVVISLSGYIPLLFRKSRINTGLWVGMPLAFLTFVMIWWGALIGRREIEVREVMVESTKIPTSFDGYRIVQFSDAHVGTWGGDTTFISAFVDRINSLNPDLIVFTGDIVNRETSELKPFIEVFSRLKARDGVLSILGNHDYGDYITWDSPADKEANMRLLKKWQKQMGWRLLNNTTHPLTASGDTIMVIGVENWGEPPFKQYGNLKQAYSDSLRDGYNLDDKHFKILLSHNPEHWLQEVTKLSNIDITMSGHTHAMQFMLSLGNWRWSPSQYRYSTWAGLYEEKSIDGTPMKLYVNVGCGEVGLPFRIGAIPEITLFTLKH